jgi:hypothetical protein
MARYLRSIDPDRHLITTSFAHPEGDRAIDALPEIDYVQTHLYGGQDPAVRLVKHQHDKEPLGKPHYVGEVGADCTGGRFSDDPEGLQIHDPLWITMASGGSGAAQPWFWESIHSYGLHGLYGAITKFTSGIDWPSEHMRRIEPRLSWIQPPDPLPRKDFHFETVPSSFTASEFNQPRTVQVDRSGVHGQLPLTEIQHGMRAHPKEHNPVRLETDLPWPTQFEVEVRAVSGWSGAALVFRLDGQEALKKDFPNTNAADDHHDLMQYAGNYRVDIPAGKHVVELENTGPDWFYCRYRLRNGVECHEPALLGWAMAGKNTVVAWVRLEARSWRRVCAEKDPPSPCPPSRLTLPQIGQGSGKAERWKAEIWDTWSGKILQELNVETDANGDVQIPLPEITRDVAVRLKRVP